MHDFMVSLNWIKLTNFNFSQNLLIILFERLAVMQINRKAKIIISTFFTAIIIIVCLIGFMIAYIPSKMQEKHTNDIVDLYFQDTGFNINSFNEDWQEQIQEFQIISDLGHSIPTYYIRQSKGYDNKTVILVHWHESNHVAMYPIAEVFLENGWNVVMYDQRAHGKNAAETVTFGYLESRDLAQVVSFTKDKCSNHVVGVLGQSMGASTISYYLGSEEAAENLSFAVIDCPYSGMYDEISWEISKGKAPVITNGLTLLGSTFCKALYGYSFDDVDIVEQIKNSNTPTLLMHSKIDQKCPFYMSENIFNAIPHNKKSFVIYENSDHLFSFWDEPERYAEETFSFLEIFVDSVNDT